MNWLMAISLARPSSASPTPFRLRRIEAALGASIGDVFFQQFLQAGKAVGAVRSFYVFQVPFVMAEGFRLVVVGTDDLLPVSCE